MDIYAVDDDPTIRDTLHLILENEGYHVIAVEDGEKVPDLLRGRQDPCVVLLDLKMRHGGVTVLEAVADDPALLGRHAYMVLSADVRGIEAARPLLQRVGAISVNKPFDLDDLLSQVATAAARLQST